MHEGWINADKLPWVDGVITFDFDKEALVSRFGESVFDEILCKGCIIEFIKNPIEVMSEFHDACQNNAIVTIITAVVDNGDGVFRDPTAKRYLRSDWIDYIAGSRKMGGYGFGVRGAFELVSNQVSGEVQTVVFRVKK